MNIEKIIKLVKQAIRERKFFKQRDPFYVLVSCILSLRTKDEITAKVAERLFRKIKSLRDLLRINQKELEKLIYPVGFYKVKARNLKKIAKILAKKNFKIPSKKEELLKLPGVGNKTASVVLSYAFNKPTIAVDTHVHRTANRIGLVKTKTPEQTQKELERIVPMKYWLDYNRIFVLFGQQICRPLKPLCERCPVKRYCNYYKEKNQNRKVYKKLFLV